jgi:bifunctional UDP-N-acetylglucosamine pyrophosphorylase / glucosamine-1-phosphate N-acetyltransferase
MKELTTPLEVIVLAAGQGKRMRSRLPKVLHPLAGRPLLCHVLDAAAALAPQRMHVVVGHGAAQVRAAMRAAMRAASDAPVNWVDQTRQRGTGHAVAQALPAVDPGSLLLVLYGDVPLVSAATLQRCVEAAAEGFLSIVTAHFDDPAELGRIVRDAEDSITGIVEYRDADADQRGIREINSGILAAPAERLRAWLAAVTPANAQGEYYLTDVVGRAVADGVAVRGIVAADAEEVTGVNDRAQLAALERVYQRRQAEALMAAGVTIADPARLDVRGRVSAGQDCFLDVNVVLEGHVRLGNDVRIGPGSVIRDAELGDGVVVHAHTVVDGAEVGALCQVGPFARLRPGTRLGEGARIGNFVETKMAVLGPGSKANHLAYLGDATLGEDCNVGAGTITCNYDGVDKHPTVIGDRVFVGSNSTLVAPLTIESDAFVAAGSTVTSPVAAGDLAVGRSRQRNIHGWKRPERRKRDS